MKKLRESLAGLTPGNKSTKQGKAGHRSSHTEHDESNAALAAETHSQLPEPFVFLVVPAPVA